MASHLWSLGLLLVVGCSGPYGEAASESSSSLDADRSSMDRVEVAKSPKTTLPSTTPAADETVDETTEALVKPESVDFSWNRVSMTAKYSFDVVLNDGTAIAPCVGVASISRRLTLRFAGDCVTPKLSVRMEDIKDFRICSAENDNWPAAVCTNANWDGTSATVAFDN